MEKIQSDIKSKSTALSNKWTTEVDSEQDKEIAKILKEEIDWEIISNILLEIGWKKVYISDKTVELFDSNPLIINSWMNENIRGELKSHRNTWVFELPEDAVAFTLKWS